MEADEVDDPPGEGLPRELPIQDRSGIATFSELLVFERTVSGEFGSLLLAMAAYASMADKP